MKNLLGICILVFYILEAKSSIPAVDTHYLPEIRYTKDEFKKEKKDLKAFDKQVKEWKKAIKQNNADYLNVVFARVQSIIQKEHSELSNRVSIRSKELYLPKAENNLPGGLNEDKPQVYNTELADKMVRVDKDDIMRKKAAADYLNNYIQVIRDEKDLMLKLHSVTSFDAQTPHSIYENITKDLQSFRNELLAEINLMKKETGKKSK